MTIQQKIIGGNDLNQGAVIQAPKGAGTESYGSTYTVNNSINTDRTAAAANANLDAHFDDPRYYSGDTAS